MGLHGLEQALLLACQHACLLVSLSSLRCSRAAVLALTTKESGTCPLSRTRKYVCAALCAAVNLYHIRGPVTSLARNFPTQGPKLPLTDAPREILSARLGRRERLLLPSRKRQIVSRIGFHEVDEIGDRARMHVLLVVCQIHRVETRRAQPGRLRAAFFCLRATSATAAKQKISMRFPPSQAISGHKGGDV